MKCSVPVDIISVNSEFPKVFDVKRKGDSLCTGRILSVCKGNNAIHATLSKKGDVLALESLGWCGHGWMPGLQASSRMVLSLIPQLGLPLGRLHSGACSFHIWWRLAAPGLSSHLRNPRGVRGPFPQWFQFVSGLILRSPSWAICHCGHGVGCVTDPAWVMCPTLGPALSHTS